MNESVKTKKALRGSLFALFLCIVLLIGTTFAWFTDTASTGVNKIQAGNLDVDLQMKDANGSWVSAEGKTIDFVKASGHENEAILWEPGCTYELPVLRVVNKGNLALKYKLKINGIQGDEELNKVIDWTYSVSGAGGDATASLDTERHLAAKSGGTDVFDTLTLQGHMQESAGNEYQGLSIDGISITVVATQDTVENDSFGNTYDKDATYPTIVKNQKSLNDAITNAASKTANVELPKDTTVTLENGIAHGGDKSRNVTITGNGDTSVVDVISNATGAEGGKLNYQRGSTFTFENLKVKAGEGSFDGIVCDELVYKNCTITGKLTLYGKATFINCTFDNTMENQYSIWTWGGTDVKFDKCTFNTNGKAILLYGQATAAKPTNLTVNNCTFNDRKSGAAGKAAIEVGNDYNATYNLVVNHATVNGFAAGKNTDSRLWANKNSMDAAHLSVTIDGKKVQ